MKRLLYLNGIVLILLSLSFTAMGQESYQYTGRPENAFMGTIVGVSMATLRPDADLFCEDLANEMNSYDSFYGFDFNHQPKIGFTGGFTLMPRIAGSFFLQTEMLYTMKGIRIKGDGFYNEYPGYYDTYTVLIDEYLILNYLNIPLYAKYYFFRKGNVAKNQGNFNVYLQTGPSIGLAIAKKIRAVVKMSGNSSDEKQTYKGFQGVDFTWDFGAGVEFVKCLDLEFRYSLGLKNVVKDEYSGDRTLKNSVVTLALGFNMPL